MSNEPPTAQIYLADCFWPGVTGVGLAAAAHRLADDSQAEISDGVATGNPQAPNCGPDVPTCGPGYPDATALGAGVEAFPGSHVTIEDSLITGNQSRPTHTTASVKAVCPGEVPCPVNFGSGAGIDNWGQMTLEHTTISDNHGFAVQSNGGGIATERGSSLTVRDSTVSGNSANAAFPTGRFASGGGIFADIGATLVVEDSSISGNQVSLANSFPHPYPKQDGAPDNANAFGGGIQLRDAASATIAGSHLDDNTITVDAPFSEPFGADAAFCPCGEFPFTLDHSTVKGNSLTVNVLSTAEGGPSGPSAFELDSGGVTISGTNISDNTTTVTAVAGAAAAFGALAFFVDGPAVMVTDSRISDNTATASVPNGAATVQGAGLLNNAPLTLDNVRVRGNTGIANGLTGLAQGGGIWNGDLFVTHDTPPAVTLQHSDVTKNTLTGSPGVTLQGGGIYTDGFPVTLNDTRIKDNSPDDCVGC